MPKPGPDPAPKPQPDVVVRPTAKSFPISVLATASPSCADLAADAAYVLCLIARNDIGKAQAATIAQSDIEAVQLALGETASDSPAAPAAELPSQPANLLLAFTRVMRALAPVTVQTLRDTDPSILRPLFGFLPFWKTYEARRLSRKITASTLFFMALAVLGDVWMRFYGPPLDQTEGSANLFGIVLQVFTPFTYGAMGACVYLLRSLHTHIHERTYDRRRNAEYGNRVLLGMVSGGAIVLLIDQVTNDNGAVIHFSGAALGFLAGYHTDFLFSTIERITAAILPKVTIDSVRRREPVITSVPAQSPSYGELVKLFQDAKTDGERALIKETIERLYPGTKSASGQ